MLKSITAREIFRIHLEVQTQLWKGKFWTDRYFVNTFSKFGNESTISKHVREQGHEKAYIVLYKTKQLVLFLETRNLLWDCSFIFIFSTLLFLNDTTLALS